MYHYEPMMDRGDAGVGIIMSLVWLAFFVIVALVVLHLLRTHNAGTQNNSNSTPLDIAKERYAKGEIDKAQFEELKKDLK